MLTTWLVTGAPGFLGMNAGVFLSGKVNLVGQARTPRELPLYDRVVAADLRDERATAALIREVRPDVVLHAAAMSGHETCAHDPAGAIAVNVTATRIISEVVQDLGSRMVYISTDAVFAGRDGDYRETDEPEPFSNYGETKLGGEQAVREAVADHLIVRTNFFGWSHRGDRSVLEFFVNALRSGTPVRGYPDFIVTSIYVQSLLQAIWDLGSLGTTGLVHVASSDARSKYEFGLTVARVFGLDEGLITPEHSEAGRHGTSRSRDISLNSDRYTALVGRPAQSQWEGVRQSKAEEQPLTGLLRVRQQC